MIKFYSLKARHALHALPSRTLRPCSFLILRLNNIMCSFSRVPINSRKTLRTSGHKWTSTKWTATSHARKRVVSAKANHSRGIFIMVQVKSFRFTSSLHNVCVISVILLQWNTLFVITFSILYLTIVRTVFCSNVLAFLARTIWRQISKTLFY